jgi:hypothetical protein
MRLREADYEVILEQQATLVNSGHRSTPSKEELAYFQKKWGNLTDPFFSKHLRPDREDTSLKIPE